MSASRAAAAETGNDDKWSDNSVVLSYDDRLLRKRDVDLLKGPHWLNDALIGFYWEYLQHKHQDSSRRDSILFVSPELTQLVKLSNDDSCAFLAPLNPTAYHYLLFPLNDCNSRDSAGGSHWSLLVFSKEANACFHLDSCRGSNKRAAYAFAKKIMDCAVTEVDCPQQENAYDCGLFTICLADIIETNVSQLAQIPGGIDRFDKFDRVKSLVATKRQELLSLIDSLKNIQK